jgi:hypothetical protein
MIIDLIHIRGLYGGELLERWLCRMAELTQFS